MPQRLTVIGDLERPDHHYLSEEHRCYFWGEYTPHEHTNGLKWRYSPTNQLIGNLKKKMDRLGQYDWRYKVEAIEQAARAFGQMWKWQELHARGVALVPMPPSRTRADPMYDPRMFEMLQTMATQCGLPLDIRDCLTFNGAVEASHETDDRPSPATLYECLSFDTVCGKVAQRPAAIFLFDDMVTTGAHFVAAVRRLQGAFPGVDVIGQFVARRRVPDPFATLD